MKTLLKLIAIALGIALAGGLLKAVMLSSDTSATPSNQSELPTAAEMVEAINKNAPAMLDNNTRFDGAYEVDSSTIGYKYTAVNFPSSYFNQPDIRSEFEREVMRQACNSNAIRELLSFGFTADYVYYANNNFPVSYIHISRNQCSSSTSVEKSNDNHPAQKKTTKHQTRRQKRSAIHTISATQRQRCNDQYVRALSEIDNLPIGEAGLANERAQREQSRCLGLQ